MKHPHAELIKAWADDTSILFHGDGWRNCDICMVIRCPEYDWQIVKQPVVEVEYYRLEALSDRSGKFGYIKYCGENWNMKLTITNGDRKNAKVELR